MVDSYIRTVDLAVTDVNTDKKAVSVPLLPGEVAGVDTVAHTIAAGSALSLPALQGRHRVLYLIEGKGVITSGDWKECFEGLSFCVPEYGQTCEITAGESSGAITRLLELTIAMGPEDAAQLEASHARLPYFIAYDKCSTYREAIKSPKTVSRTLLHPGLVPRFATGSVQTTGPDAVGEHAHPMLEQFFLGLPGCDCVVTADGHSAPLRAWTLLHIPLGSTHGVTVADGCSLHYVWVDVFRSKEREKWIAEQHKEDGE